MPGELGAIVLVVLGPVRVIWGSMGMNPPGPVPILLVEIELADWEYLMDFSEEVSLLELMGIESVQK